MKKGGWASGTWGPLAPLPGDRKENKSISLPLLSSPNPKVSLFWFVK